MSRMSAVTLGAPTSQPAEASAGDVTHELIVAQALGVSWSQPDSSDGASHRCAGASSGDVELML